MKMADIKKKILMKVRRIEYKHVNFPEEYIETERKYKKYRNNFNKVGSSIASLMNYEHGGNAKKKLYQGLSIISSVSNLNFLDNHDVFEAMSIICSNFADEDNDKLLRENNKMATAYRKISEAKMKFNENCAKEMGVLKNCKQKIEIANKERENAKIYRYDLENAKENESSENREECERFEELFNKSCVQALSAMNDFLGDDGVQGVLKKVLEYNVDFFRVGLEALEKAK